MYWQVYLHKTVVSAEFLLIHVLNRAREIENKGQNIFTTPTLNIFLKNNFSPEDFKRNVKVEGKNVLDWYTLLDDNDIFISVKEWQNNSDLVLSKLANSLFNRKLFKNTLLEKPVSKSVENKIIKEITNKITHDIELARHFLMTGEITNNAYNQHNESILVLDKNKKLKDIRQASDINLSALSKTVRKYYLCYPKELDIN
jgi:hypothetical protein